MWDKPREHLEILQAVGRWEGCLTERGSLLRPHWEGTLRARLGGRDEASLRLET